MLEFIEVLEPSRIKTQVVVDSNTGHDKGVSAMLIIFQPDHPQVLSPGHIESCGHVKEVHPHYFPGLEMF